MSSNFNAADIWDFVNGYRQQSSPSHENWSSYGHYTTPRQPSPLAYDVEADPGTAGLVSTFDQMSMSDGNYTTVSRTTAPSSRRSVMSSAQFTAPSTVQSSAPPRRAPQPTFPEQFANAPEPAPESQQFILWCEFCVLDNCDAIFRGDDESGWIDHHVRHLHDHFPKRLMCWFCDDVPFVAERSADRFANFVLRMQHIRGHIFDEHQTRNSMRPDFHVISHLRKHNLIDEETFNHAMGYDELPPALRLPGESAEPLSPPQTSRDREQYVVTKERRRRRDRERDPNRRRR